MSVVQQRSLAFLSGVCFTLFLSSIYYHHLCLPCLGNSQLCLSLIEKSQVPLISRLKQLIFQPWEGCPTMIYPQAKRPLRVPWCARENKHPARIPLAFVNRGKGETRPLGCISAF